MSLKNDKIDDKYIIRALKKRLKILEIAQNRTRNTFDFIMSSFVSSFVNHIAKMTADINASNRLEKTKRSIIISNSTIFIENKTKFEHWLSAMQNKLEINENWYLIERITMIYVNIKLNDEIYKHITIQLNKNFSRQYLTINEVFDDLKRVYVNSNKMQIVIIAFIKLTQTNKYVEFHIFWNKFQRLIKKMNWSKHFLLIELKRKMFYKLQNVMFIEFNIINDIYELTRQTQLKENHYKRIDDVKSRRQSNAVVTIEIETKIAINRTMSIITISIDEKIEQTSARTTIWNFHQFRIWTFRVIFKTFNLDSIKKEFMKTNKYFNCNESSHFNHDYSKSKKFKIVEMNVKNDTKKSKKDQSSLKTLRRRKTWSFHHFWWRIVYSMRHSC